MAPRRFDFAAARAEAARHDLGAEEHGARRDDGVARPDSSLDLNARSIAEALNDAGLIDARRGAHEQHLAVRDALHGGSRDGHGGSRSACLDPRPRELVGA
jgi:hypothetical protein